MTVHLLLNQDLQQLKTTSEKHKRRAEDTTQESSVCLAGTRTSVSSQHCKQNYKGKRHMCEMWTLLPQTSKSSLSEVHRRYLHHSAKQFPGFLLETGHINTLNYSLRKTDSRVFIGNWLLQPSAYHRSTFQYLRRTVFYTIKVCIYLPVQEHPPPTHTY